MRSQERFLKTNIRRTVKETVLSIRRAQEGTLV